MNNPRVSIGLPVFNGEKYVGAALESLLSQTFGDFEILISDNCSSDGTRDICARYCSRDNRVRYFRQDRNIGPVKNFNGLVPRARGEYFKWAPHDDIYAPTFLERCVEVLDSDPSVVVCQSWTKIIDENDAELHEYRSELRADSPLPHVRFHDLLMNEKCFEIFGLIRRKVLVSTPLLGSFGHADGVLLARLGLHGRIVQIPEFLYSNRHHPGKSLHQYSNYRAYTVWLDPSKAGKILLPRWRMGWEFTRAVLEVPLTTTQRVMCLGQMPAWAFRFWKSLAANLLYAGGQAIGVVR